MNRELALKAILRLNPVLRCAFLLHKREGWTHQEMAKKLGVSVETAKSRVFGLVGSCEKSWKSSPDNCQAHLVDERGLLARFSASNF
jgi:DNA-directed RNA polymerase specialized sigma24 family protein